jgi:hypothetical protein
MMRGNISSRGINGVMKKYIPSNSLNLASAMMAAGDNKSLDRAAPTQGMPTRNIHHVLALWLCYAGCTENGKGIYDSQKSRRKYGHWRSFYAEPYAVNTHPLCVESSKKGTNPLT